MSDYTIRRLTVNDAEKLYLFYQDNELKTFYRPYGENVALEDIVSMPIARIAANTELGLIIVNNKGDILGHAFLRQNPNNKTEYGFGIGLNSKLRGKGLGRKLMQDLFKLGEDTGVKRITLSVFSKNTKALNLYKSFGFKEVKRATSDKNEESIYMIKSLT